MTITDYEKIIAEEKYHRRRAFIYTGGDCDVSALIFAPTADDLVIAADSGYKTARRAGANPQIVLGDFDSMAAPVEGDFALVRFPAEKDATDTGIAVDLACDLDSTETIIIGGLGGRFDHAMSNLLLLEVLAARQIPAALTDGTNIVRLIENTTVTLHPRGYKYFSLISQGSSTVTITGCKYPLSSHTLSRSNPSLGVSNEIIDAATITLTGAPALLIESEHTARENHIL